MLDTLRQDVRYGFRTFTQSPGFTAIALVTLALGIGANTAIFSVINGVLLKPLRFGDPDDLMVVWETRPSEGIDASQASAGIFLDWRQQNQTFDDLTAWFWSTFVLEAEDDSVALNGVFVYPNFFSVLLLEPLFGRPFTMDDAPIPGQRGDVTLISHALWQERWGADPAIVGRSVRIDGHPMTIIGVMRPDVAAPATEADVWIPARFQSPVRWERHRRRLTVYGRLAPGSTQAQAQEDLSRVASALATGEYKDIYEGWNVRVAGLQEEIVGDSRASLVIAFAAVGLVLLIAVVNLANMLLARSAQRQREMALRTALGAGRHRITRQLLTESLLLATAGGALGLLFAQLTHRLLLAFEPGILPRVEELALDPWALVFALGVSLVTGLLFGLIPALHGARLDLQSTLKLGSSQASSSSSGLGGGGRRQSRLRGVLVAAQLALAMVLLCGAGLLIRSLLELATVDPGFKPKGSVAARIFLEANRYDSADKVAQYFDRVEERLEALPGVESVGATSALPMDPMGINYDLPYRLEGQGQLPTNELPEADFRVVTPDYFETLKVPLLAGRSFADSDRAGTPLVALVNETMARRTWPGKEAVAERFETPSTNWNWFEVVGVVGDTKYYGLGVTARPEIYVAQAQVPRSNLTFVVRTGNDAAALTDPVRREILRQDPGQPSHSVVTLESLLAESMATDRFYALVLGIFAAVALILSGAGIYGVLSYWVNQRIPEIGLHMALGATRGTLLRRVVGHGMGLTFAGVAVGLAAALASTRVLAGVLYGVGTADPLSFLGAAALLSAIALMACALPAVRASRVDPMLALREE